MKIQILPDIVINKIAAGEVVDRPVSVVRELLDNAVDAGASEISVFIERGGRGAIEVHDNGEGMSRDDALLAFERHATSKIKTAADLSKIATYGFRGEALASIAAVSHTILRTRQASATEGTEIRLRAGAVQEVQAIAAPVGSSVHIKNLFFNMPARKKFLRKEVTEERRIKSWVSQFALANPGIRFRLLFDGKEALILPADRDHISRVRRLIRGTAVEVEQRIGDVFIRGLIGHPSLAQYDSGNFTIMVNGRVVSDRLILKAVREGFDSTLKDREVPTGCIALEVPPDEVDVNVHPQKSEVRFFNPASIFQLVRESILSATKSFRTPVFEQQRPAPIYSQPAQGFPQTAREQFPLYNQTNRELSVLDSESTPLQIPEQQDRSEAATVLTAPGLDTTHHFSFSELRYIGQALDCYLLCEYNKQLVVVDMHAAHERINFNIIRNSYAESEVMAQQLLIPLSITLTPESCDIFDAQQMLLEKLGFEIDRIAENAIAVRAVPTILANQNIEDCIKQMASHELTLAITSQYQHFVNALAARIACHASIRSGYQIKREEVYALFDRLDSSEFSAACPHGRPVVVLFEKSDVEKWFGRDR